MPVGAPAGMASGSLPVAAAWPGQAVNSLTIFAPDATKRYTVRDLYLGTVGLTVASGIAIVRFALAFVEADGVTEHPFFSIPGAAIPAPGSPYAGQTFLVGSNFSAPAKGWGIVAKWSEQGSQPGGSTQSLTNGYGRFRLRFFTRSS
jgi:hypothetical protein